MKLALVLAGWLSLIVAFFIVRLGLYDAKELAVEMATNVWHGFANMMLMTFGYDSRYEIEFGILTFSHMVGGALAILLLAIQANILLALFGWSVEWACA